MENITLYNDNKFLSFIKKNWHIIVLILIGMLSFFFNFYAISKYGYGNEYYASAIKSMTLSFKNFFFVSFDPAGMVSIDKPPVGFWLQAISVLIFGYHGWAMLLPQALAGTASCIMMYILISKHFGRPAGLISSFIFSFTPSVVVASRNNTIDMQLILVLLIATWFLFRSIETGRKKHLFIAGALIGLGFNIKMLQAYLVLPGFALIYLIFAKNKLIKKLINGIITLVIVGIVSFAWVFAVDLYPSNNRPYVGSSTNNTVMELIVGHNGLERVYGESQSSGGNPGGNNGAPGSGQGTPPNMQSQDSENSTENKQDNTQGAPDNSQPGTPSQNNNSSETDKNQNTQPNNQGFPPNSTQNDEGNTNQPGGPQGGAPVQNADGQNSTQPNGQGVPQGGGPGGGQGGSKGSGEIGTASILRLWNSNLYGQASWLITFAAFSILIFIRKFKLNNLNIKQAIIGFWSLWLGTMSIFFSFASFYHRYYLCMFAPCIAALCGIGLVKMLEEFKNKNSIKQFILPIALITTVGIQLKYVWSYSQLRTWLIPSIAITSVITIILIIVNYIRPKKFASLLIGGFMLISMGIAPFYWALTPVMYVPNSTLPYAGPELASQNDGGIPQSGSSAESNKTSEIEKYLVDHYKSGSFLVVSQRSSDVAQFIMDTGLPAYAYGGFLGSDNSLTLDKVKEYVSEGKITYFLLSDGGMGGNSDIGSYVKENATLIDPTEYGGTSNNSSHNGPGGSASLYYFNNIS